MDLVTAGLATLLRPWQDTPAAPAALSSSNNVCWIGKLPHGVHETQA